MTPPKILAVGGAHVDRRGRVTGDYAPAASNPGRMLEEVGGGAFNAARAARLRGCEVALFSIRGGDAAGAIVAEAVAAAGLRDLSACYLDRVTPSYTAILDREGELVAALADMGLYELAFAKQVGRRAFRDAAASADALLLDANLPAPAIAKALAAAGGRPAYAIGVSPAKVVRLKPHLARLAGLFINRREAAALAPEASQEDALALAEALGRAGAARVVVTAGAGDMAAWAGGTLLRLTPPRVETVDVTGAGDALAGATIAALAHGRSFGEALREGAAAAALTVAAPGAAADLDPTRFAAALASVGRPVQENVEA